MEAPYKILTPLNFITVNSLLDCMSEIDHPETDTIDLEDDEYQVIN